MLALEILLSNVGLDCINKRNTLIYNQKPNKRLQTSALFAEKKKNLFVMKDTIKHKQISVAYLSIFLLEKYRFTS